MASDDVSRSRYEMMKKDSAERIEKLSGQVKALKNQDFGDVGASDGLASVATGSVAAIMRRWTVQIPGTSSSFGKVAPLSIIYGAAWPLLRKGLSKGVRRHGDRLWNYQLARFGDDMASSGIDSLMDMSKA